MTGSPPSTRTSCPDLITTAKGIAGGMPLAALTGRADVMDAIHVGGLGGTYGGNPVACASALAAIETMKADDLAGRARAVEALFRPAARGARRQVRRDRRHPRPRGDAGGRAGQRPRAQDTRRRPHRPDQQGLPRARPGHADLRHLRQRVPVPAAAVGRRRPARPRASTSSRTRSPSPSDRGSGSAVRRSAAPETCLPVFTWPLRVGHRPGLVPLLQKVRPGQV